MTTNSDHAHYQHNTCQADRNAPMQIDYARLLTDASVAIMQHIDYACYDRIIDNRNYLHSFVSTVFHKSRVTYSILIAGLLYLMRFKQCVFRKPSFALASELQQPDFVLRLFVVSLIISSKFVNDRHISNASWAKIHSFSLVDINRAEVIFLQVIDHNIHINEQSFQYWMTQLFDADGLRRYMVSALPPTPPYHYNVEKDRL